LRGVAARILVNKFIDVKYTRSQLFDPAQLYEKLSNGWVFRKGGKILNLQVGRPEGTGKTMTDFD
jgi:prolipoprotein diacylglyceryltransferase